MITHAVGTRQEHLQARLELLEAGLDAFNATYQLLDRAPYGRNEDDLPVPVAWLRRHDEYQVPP